MQKIVKKEIEKIDKWVIGKIGSSISCYLYSIYENYEYNEDGKKSSCDYIIRGLWNEAENFVDLCEREEYNE